MTNNHYDFIKSSKMINYFDEVLRTIRQSLRLYKNQPEDSSYKKKCSKIFIFEKRKNPNFLY